MLIFCHGDVSKLNQTLGKKHINYTEYTWGLLGDNYTTFEELLLLLGNGNRDTEIGPLFHNISRKLKTPMLEFMGELSKNNHSLEWWCTGLASKSIFQQDLFVRACYIQLIHEIDKEGKDIFLYVPDVEFYLFLKGSFDQRFIFIDHTIPLFQNTKRYFHRFKTKCSCIAGLAVHKFRLISAPTQTLDMETLVFSWIVGKSFDSDLHYKDLWGGRFYDEFSKVSNCKRFTYSMIESESLEKALCSDSSFIYTSAHCSWFELFLTCFKRVSLKKNNKYYFQGIDLEPLIDLEIGRNNGGLIFQYIVFYKGLSRIINKSPKLKIIFHPFEGQPWEKIIKLAIENSKRDIKTFGFQHSGFSELHLSNFCSGEEHSLNTMPDYILANSDYNRRKLSKNRFPPDRILTIGDLRLGYLAKKQGIIGTSGNNKVETILVCLTVKLDESLMALRDCCMAFIKLRRKGYQFRVYVKPHPLAQFNMGKLSFVKKLNDYIEYYDGDLKPMLDLSDLLIYINGSVGCEALQLGKTVIQKMTDLSLDKDPLNLREKQSFLYHCFFNELEGAMEMLMTDNFLLEKAKNDKKKMPSFFDPIQYHNFMKIVQLAEL